MLKSTALLLAIPAVLATAQASANEVTTKFQAHFANPGDRSYQRLKTTYSTKAGDLKTSVSMGVETYRNPHLEQQYQTNVPIDFAAEYSDGKNAYRAEIGVDVTSDGTHPSGALQYERKGKTRVTAKAEYGLETASADTIDNELNRAEVSARVVHPLSPKTTLDARAKQQWYSDSNSISQAQASISHQVAKGTTVSGQVLHRKAKQSGEGYWTPEGGVTQITGEVRQILPLGKKTQALIGIRAGVGFTGDGEARVLAGTGLGLRHQFSDLLKGELSGTVGYGMSLQGSLRGRF